MDLMPILPRLTPHETPIQPGRHLFRRQMIAADVPVRVAKSISVGNVFKERFEIQAWDGLIRAERPQLALGKVQVNVIAAKIRIAEGGRQYRRMNLKFIRNQDKSNRHLPVSAICDDLFEMEQDSLPLFLQPRGEWSLANQQSPGFNFTESLFG